MADASTLSTDAGASIEPVDAGQSADIDAGQTADIDASIDPCLNGGCPETCDTTVLVCGQNSHCSDTASIVPVCECDSGYQDNDGDEECTAACALHLPSCGENNICSDVTGVATCSCPVGTVDIGGNCHNPYVELHALSVSCQLFPTVFGSCRVTMSNSGTVDANNVLVALYLQPSAQLTGPTYFIGSCVANSVGIFGQTNVNCSVSGYEGLLVPGFNAIHAVVNPNNTIDEITYINNSTHYNYFHFE